MRKGNLTREQAIDIVGVDAVNLVDATNMDFTNRVQTDGDTDVEFSASVQAVTVDHDLPGYRGDDVTLVAYAYQDQVAVDEVDDLGNLDWKIEGYEIV